MNFPWGRLLIIIQYQASYVGCFHCLHWNKLQHILKLQHELYEMNLKKPKPKFKNICTMKKGWSINISTRCWISGLSDKKLKDLPTVSLVSSLLVVSSLALSDGDESGAGGVTSWQMLSINGGAKLKHVITSKLGSGIARLTQIPMLHFITE